MVAPRARMAALVLVVLLMILFATTLALSTGTVVRVLVDQARGRAPT
jgi:hypothetical protein